MAKSELVFGKLGGASEIIVAAIVNNQSTSEALVNSDYVSISANKATITFNKKVKGIITTQNRITAATVTYNTLSTRRAYTDYITEFEANVGDTITLETDFTYAGYGIFCIDA